jgi:hypothetical protein
VSTGRPTSGADAALDADRIAAAVLACPQVSGLHGGRFGEVATYLPGRRVTGVTISADEVEVHLVAAYPATITEIDHAVRAALAEVTGGLAVTIVVEDLAAPGEPAPTRAGPPAPTRSSPTRSGPTRSGPTTPPRQDLKEI